METLMNATPIEIASNTVLAVAIIGMVGLLFALRQAAIQGGGIFPAIIPTLFIFTGAIAGVELLHVSPFHLIWLFILSLVLGIAAIMVPPIQTLSMGFLVLLKMTELGPDHPEITSTSKPTPSRSKPKSTRSKSSKGFGT
jgi:hypothetical protein